MFHTLIGLGIDGVLMVFLGLGAFQLKFSPPNENVPVALGMLAAICAMRFAYTVAYCWDRKN